MRARCGAILKMRGASWIYRSDTATWATALQILHRFPRGAGETPDGGGDPAGDWLRPIQAICGPEAPWFRLPGEWGACSRYRGDRRGAIEALQKAVKLSDALARDFPGNANAHTQVVDAYLGIAFGQKIFGDCREAMRWWESARARVLEWKLTVAKGERVSSVRDPRTDGQRVLLV